jgi:hypothetical protein
MFAYLLHVYLLFTYLLTGLPCPTLRIFHQVGCFNGVGAYCCCPYCRFEGQRQPGWNTTYYKGYEEAVPQGIHFQGRMMQVADDAEALRYTDREQFERGRRVEALVSSHPKPTQQAVRQKIMQEGCHGVSSIPRTLPYVSYNNVFLLPLVHALLHGVVKDFLRFILRPLPSPPAPEPLIISRVARRELANRAGHLVLTSGFGRKYK